MSVNSAANMTGERTYKHPVFWVPTAYFAEGVIYITVTLVSAIMLKNLGLSNEAAAGYASSLTLPYVIKPLWAPLLEMFKTKKFFVILMQLVLAAALAGIALVLPMKAFLLPALVLFWICGFSGATMDIGTDGVYVTTLPAKRQAAFAGVQSMAWSIGPIVASGVLLSATGYLHDEKQMGYATAWMIIFFIIAGMLLLMSLYHSAMLPPGAKAKDAPKDVGDAMRTFGKAFVTFFQKKDIWLMIAFAYLFRFGIGLLDKMGPIFLIDKTEAGGLGLSNQVLGNIIGTFGTAGFLVGSLLGGFFVAKTGLKRVLFFLCLCINIPNLTFVYLSQTMPTSSTLVTAVVTLEKFGYGFGAVGHMLYMMQQIAPGPYKTAHYAFATGFMGLCMMSTGMASGFIQAAVGYQWFFIIVMLCAIPSLLATWFAPFHQSETEGGGDDEPEPSEDGAKAAAADKAEEPAAE